MTKFLFIYSSYLTLQRTTVASYLAIYLVHQDQDKWIHCTLEIALAQKMLIIVLVVLEIMRLAGGTRMIPPVEAHSHLGKAKAGTNQIYHSQLL